MDQRVAPAGPAVDPPAGRRVGLRRRIAPLFTVDVRVLLLYAVLGVVMTWPVARYFLTHLPSAGGDPPFVSWLLSWQGHAVTHTPTEILEAPIFYPFRGALLLSETMFGGALLALPVWLITHSPAATFNLVVLVSFPIAAFGMYLLARDITDSRIAAFAAGIAFAFSMYRLSRIDVLHIVLIMWIPYAVFFFRRFLLEPRWFYAIATIATIWLQLVSSGHGILMLVIAMLVIAPVLAIVHRKVLRDRRLWIRGAAAAVLLALGAAPVVVPYMRLYRAFPEFRRGAEEVAYYSSGAGAYGRAPKRAALYLSQPLRPVVRAMCADDECLDRSSRDALFPGFVVLVVAAGAATRFRARKRQERVWLGIFAAIALLAGMLSIGTDSNLSGPYGLAYRLVPALDTIRVPGRISVLTTFGLAGLVALSVASLQRSKWFRPGDRSRLAGCMISVLLLFDVLPSAARAVPAPRVPHVYEALAKSPSRAAMVELPMPQTRGRRPDGRIRLWSSSSKRDIPYMYFQTRHWRPIVNGFSGNRPPTYFQSIENLLRFPGPLSIDHLRKIKVGCVVVHRRRAAVSAWRHVERRMRPYWDAVVLDDGEVFVVDVARLPMLPNKRTGPPCLGD